MSNRSTNVELATTTPLPATQTNRPDGHKNDDMNEFMIVTDHGTNKIPESILTKQLRPTELHYKADGSKDDSPSFVIVLRDVNNKKYIGQFSLATITDCFEQLGYTLTLNTKPYESK